jgi:hypothetical protein
LTTSYLQGKVSPIMTSITSNHYAGPVMDESKTKSSSESPGETLSSNNWKPKIIRALNDLLPYRFRPIKSRRRRHKPKYGWRSELMYLRLTWVSHRRPALIKAIRQLFITK